ncbi:cortex morphogenetic protein CmpA [Texcoconibacillus texcoconensis]|uniref:Cortex morphogenetic protein CmpA n=1 Tax=Texcoconibacillus texcoconensis TaxID=1095777 RepID=A0A840QSB1_9BACI|nr:cortex morphogenetic protein CmpA [Texcoconibacillus texcoconensis]MBB5174203.1 hypothetical protein [Texcoconibacillus texcoconensis]
MPTWLKQQLREAYLNKDLYRIRLLNQCWFYYQKIHGSASSRS